MSLQIIDLNQEQAIQHPLTHTQLPNPAKKFRMIVIASSGSGKSMMIKNMVTRDEFGYKDFFNENIFIISETLGLDSTWDSVQLPKYHKMNTWDDTVVKQLMDYSKKSKNGTLWILDDLVCNTDCISRGRKTLLDKIFVQGRHHKISLIITSQKYNALSPIMRENASHVIVFGLHNVSEKKQFLSDHANIPDIEEKYAVLTTPYNFLYINKSNGDVYKNFEERL